jgi:hypothetical protein
MIKEVVTQSVEARAHLRHTQDADNSFVALLFDEFSYDGLEFDRTLDRSAFEIDPAFVESVQHPNPWPGIFHALRIEQPFPGFMGHHFRSNRAVKNL